MSGKSGAAPVAFANKTRLRSPQICPAPEGGLRWRHEVGAMLLSAQPIRLLADRTAPPSFEVLVRLRDEAGEINAPGEFMALQTLAEEERNALRKMLAGG